MPTEPTVEEGGASDRLKMRDLEALTGIGRETIRYYIREGVLPEPEKPRRNVAFYSAEHVERLRLIKQLQEKRFLPLAVIRELLDTGEARALTEGPRLAGIEHLLPELMEGASPGPSRSLAELARSTGLTPGEIRELARMGVVSSEGERFDFRDAAILELWGRVRAAGFSPERGYGARTLELFREMTRALADQEVEEFFAAFGDAEDVDAEARRAAEGLRLVNEIFALMHVRAVIGALARRNAGDAGARDATGADTDSDAA